MEIGSSFQLSENPKPKQYLLIKVPAKIVNKEKVIECLGGKKNIITKNAKNENIELKLLYKKLPLEKCISNDILLKRKTKRCKKDPTKVKYEYEVMGKISNQYEFFAMHDFIYDSNVSDFSINDLKQFYISKDDYLKELETIKKETPENEKDSNDKETFYSQTQKTKAIHNLHEKANEESECKTLNPNDICSFFQPNHIANLRNSYPKQFKELFEDFKLEYMDDF